MDKGSVWHEGMVEYCCSQMLLWGLRVGTGAMNPGDLRVPELCH